MDLRFQIRGLLSELGGGGAAGGGGGGGHGTQRAPSGSGTPDTTGSGGLERVSHRRGGSRTDRNANERARALIRKTWRSN